jgi:hypothetical protein
MLRILATTVCALVLSGSTVEEGEAWLEKAQDQLYRWPEPHSIVRFEVHTDVLAPMIAAMKSELEKNPDAEASKLVTAIEKLEIHGAIDTATGGLQTEIKIDYPETDPRTKKAIGTIKQRLQSTLTGCFAGLPLHDPRLLRQGAVVTAAEERTDERLVVSAGAGHGDSTVLHFSRKSDLPTRFELPMMTIDVSYTEAGHRRYVPATLEMQPKGGPSSRAEFSWQKKGDVWFPEHVKLSSKTANAKIDFDKLTLEPRER